MHFKLHLVLPTAATAVMLTSCASTLAAPGRTAAPSYRNDPDIVFMGGSGANGSGSSAMDVAPMTYEELLTCATQVRDLDGQQKRLDAETARIDLERARLERQGNQLDLERPKVDFKDGKAVDAYNGRLQVHRAAISSFNLEVEKHNTAVNGKNLLRNQFNAGCAHRSYRRSHYAILPLPLRAAIDANTSEADAPKRQ